MSTVYFKLRRNCVLMVICLDMQDWYGLFHPVEESIMIDWMKEVEFSSIIHANIVRQDLICFDN